MKANLPPTHKKAKRSSITVDQLARQIAQEYINQSNSESTRRLFKLMCLVLHDDFEFGLKRISRFLDEIIKLSDEKEHDEVFWYHVDKRVIDEIGVQFEYEDYDKVDK